MFRSHKLFVRLLVAGLLILTAISLSACNDQERQKMVGQWVKLSNVAQVGNNVVDGWTATVTSQDGKQSTTVMIEWKHSINSDVIVNGAWAKIDTVPASVGSGSATVWRGSSESFQVTYYIR